MKPLINLLAASYAKGGYDAGCALECSAPLQPEIKGGVWRRRVRADAAVPAGACRGLPARGGDSESDGGIEMTVDGLYWDEAGRADVGMIEPGDTVYCICRGADGLFPSRAAYAWIRRSGSSTSATARSSSASPRRSEPSALRRFGLVGSVFVSRRAADRRAAELNAAREGER